MTLTTEDFDNAERDLKTVSAVSNSRDPDTNAPIDSYNTRLGDISDTLNGRLKKIGYEPPIAYAGGISFALSDNVKTVDESGVIYAPLPSALPFTTSGTWVGDDDARFFVVQSFLAGSVSPEFATEGDLALGNSLNLGAIIFSDYLGRLVYVAGAGSEDKNFSYRVVNTLADIDLGGGLYAKKVNPSIEKISDIAELQGVDISSFSGGEIRHLVEREVGEGSGGNAEFVSGDQSANVSNDEEDIGQGNGFEWIAPSSDLTGSSGAWHVLPRLQDRATSIATLAARMYRGETVKIACYGDSTTDGNGSTGWTANPTDGNGDALGGAGSPHTPSNAFPTYLQAWLREFYGNNNIQVFNAGYSGKPMFRSDDPQDDKWAVRNYENAIDNIPGYGDHDLVFIGFGTNDTRTLGSNSEGFISEYRKLIRKILAKGRIPVVVGPDYFYRWSTTDTNNNEASREINAACKQVADEFNLVYLDFEEETRQEINNQTDYLGLYNLKPDLLHSGDGGQAYRAGIHMRSIVKGIGLVDQDPVYFPHIDPNTQFQFPQSADQTDLRGTSKFGSRWNLSGGSYSQGDPIMSIWVWVRGRSASLFWSAFTNSNIDQNVAIANRPKLDVKNATDTGDWNSNLPIQDGEIPAVGVTPINKSGVREIDRNYFITTLLPGLNKIELKAPAVGMTGGYFYIDPWFGDIKQGNRNQLPRSHVADFIQTDAGEYLYREENINGQELHKFMIREPKRDGSDYISVGRDGEAVEIWLDVDFITNESSIFFGIGKVTNSTGTADFVGGGLGLFVNAAGAPNLGYFEDGLFTTLPGGSGVFTSPGVSQQIVIRIERSGDAYLVDVFDDWTKTNNIISYDSSTNGFQIGGVCGLAPVPGVFFPGGSPANTIRQIHINKAILKHKVV